MKAETVFDLCWEVFKKCAEEAYDAGHLHALDATAFKEHRWKPNYRPKAEDFLADFWLAGHEALEQRGLHSRVVLFDVYYIGQAEYERARRVLGLSEMGWVNWSEEIRRIVGAELERRGVFPATTYFKEVFHHAPEGDCGTRRVA